MLFHKITPAIIVTALSLSCFLSPSLILFSSLAGQAQTLESSAIEPESLMQQGEQQITARDYVLAEKFFNQALIIYRNLNNLQGQEKALSELESISLRQFNFKKATEYAQQLAGLKAQRRRTLNQQADVSRNLPDSEKKFIADKLLEQGNQDFTDWARFRSSFFGESSAYPEKFGSAVEAWKKALKIHQGLKDYKGQEGVLFKLGFAYEKHNEPKQSVTYYNQLVTLYQKSQNHKMEGRILSLVGSALNELPGSESNNFSKVIEDSKKSLKIAQEFKDDEWEGKALLNLADAYKNRGEYSKEIENLQPLLVFFQKSNNIAWEKNVLVQLGIAYKNVYDYDRSAASFQKLLGLIQANKGKDGKDGDLVILAGSIPPKLRKEFGGIVEEAKAFTMLGNSFYKAGNYDAAEVALMNAIKVWEFARSKITLAKGQRIFSEFSEFTFSEKERLQALFFDEQNHTYNLLQKALIQKIQTKNKSLEIEKVVEIEKALEISESGRMRSILEMPFSKDSQPLSVQGIRQVAKAHNSTLVEYAIIEDEIKDYLKPQPKNRASELFIWVVKPNGKIAFRKVDLKELLEKEKTSLEDLVKSARSAINSRSPSIEITSVNKLESKQQFQLLYKLLIEPIADLLPTDPKAQVVFIPQQSLHLVPFSALQDQSNRYLIEKHTISIAPSIQTLALTSRNRQSQLNWRNRERKDNEYLVVGNPTMPRFLPEPLYSSKAVKTISFPPLPSAEQEALTIANLLNTQALIRDSATKRVVLQKLQTANIIHLATHGYLSTDILDSAVILAPTMETHNLFSQRENRHGFDNTITTAPVSQINNGFLAASEISDMSLIAELVVLSACDTGQGTITWDGVIGLSRAFVKAGVPSVIVSLWSIPDIPTAELMVEFYRNWRDKKMDKAQALRQAMLTTMKTHPNPRDWAAFTLIGEAE